MNVLRSVVVAMLVAAAARAQVCSTPYSPVTQSITDADGNALSYDALTGSWFTGVHALPVRTCPNGVAQCLLVPQFHSSAECDIQDPASCGWTNATSTQGCQVTDEFSQVGMALAMSTDAAHFAQWYNTLQAILVSVDNTADKLPAWRQRIDWTGAQAAITVSETDDASDATARIIIALYIAADSNAMSSQRAAYLSLANQLAAVFAARDYVKHAITARNRVVNNWLASGWVTAKFHPDVICSDGCTFSYAGYYGDAAIAMLAAYAHTHDSAYLTIVDDTVQNYLTASAWNPGTFRVPPTAFAWVSGLATECRTNCQTDGLPQDEWDGSDAPRAVSLCKLAYYENLAGLPVTPDLQSYCTDWMSTHALSYGTAASTYNKRFTVSGMPFEPNGIIDSYFNNGLGTYLNFFCGPDEVWTRLRAIFERKFHLSSHVFNSEACFGVYDQAFSIIALGSALGLDQAAFKTHSTLTATAGATNVALSWTPIAGAVSYEIWRRSTGAWSAGVSTTQTTYTDTPPAGAAYVYCVRGILANGTPTSFSNDDLATPFAFADDPIVARSTPIRNVQITNLRTVVDAVQRTAGIVPAAYTGGVIVRAVHINELRDRLDAARAALGLPAVSYSQQVTPGATIRAADVTELRNGTR